MLQFYELMYPSLIYPKPVSAVSNGNPVTRQALIKANKHQQFEY